MVNVGDPAPNATIKLTGKERLNETIDLEQLYKQGTSILYFFPAVFTGVCTKSSCDLRDNLNQFNSLGTQIYGISTDMPFSQKKFIDEYNLNYPILSDWNREAIEQFGVIDNNFGRYFRGVSKRAIFAVKDGIITFQWVAENPGEYPPFDELKNHLQK